MAIDKTMDSVIPKSNF